MNIKKIFLLSTIIIISTITFNGCGKTTNDNTINNEKAKVEDKNKKENTEKEINQKDSQNETNIKNTETEEIGEENVEINNNDSSEEEKITLKKYDAIAKIEPLMFGANVTVTSDAPEVATYEIYSEIEGNMEAIQENKAAIGEAVLAFPAKEGQKVLIKFYDANDNLLGESETSLIL